MSDPIWISAANAHHPESVLNKIRAEFSVEAISRPTHFCTLKQRSKRYPSSPQTTFGLALAAPLRKTIGPSWP
jgi:hypothetical protein